MIKKIVIHASASPHRGDTAEDIHRWHRKKGWDGIGYHYVISEGGKIEAGRPHYWQGSHVKNHNKNTLGICLLGMGTSIDDFTFVQMDALYSLLSKLHTRYPDAEIVGHRDLDPDKDCPGFNVKEWLEDNPL